MTKSKKAKISRGQFWLLKKLVEAYESGKATFGEPAGIVPSTLQLPYPDNANFIGINMCQLRGLQRRNYCSEKDGIYKLTTEGLKCYFEHIDPFIQWQK